MLKLSCNENMKEGISNVSEEDANMTAPHAQRSVQWTNATGNWHPVEGSGHPSFSSMEVNYGAAALESYTGSQNSYDITQLLRIPGNNHLLKPSCNENMKEGISNVSEEVANMTAPHAQRCVQWTNATGNWHPVEGSGHPSFSSVVVNYGAAAPESYTGSQDSYDITQLLRIPGNNHLLKPSCNENMKEGISNVSEEVVNMTAPHAQRCVQWTNATGNWHPVEGSGHPSFSSVVVNYGAAAPESYTGSQDSYDITQLLRIPGNNHLLKPSCNENMKEGISNVSEEVVNMTAPHAQRCVQWTNATGNWHPVEGSGHPSFSSVEVNYGAAALESYTGSQDSYDITQLLRIPGNNHLLKPSCDENMKEGISNISEEVANMTAPHAQRSVQWTNATGNWHPVEGSGRSSFASMEVNHDAAESYTSSEDSYDITELLRFPGNNHLLKPSCNENMKEGVNNVSEEVANMTAPHAQRSTQWTNATGNWHPVEGLSRSSFASMEVNHDADALESCTSSEDSCDSTELESLMQHYCLMKKVSMQNTAEEHGHSNLTGRAIHSHVNKESREQQLSNFTERNRTVVFQKTYPNMLVREINDQVEQTGTSFPMKMNQNVVADKCGTTSAGCYADMNVHEGRNVESTEQQGSSSNAQSRKGVMNGPICLHTKQFVSAMVDDLNQRTALSSKREIKNNFAEEENSNSSEVFVEHLSNMYEQVKTEPRELQNSNSKERDVAKVVVDTIYMNAEQLAREMLDLVKQGHASSSPMQVNHSADAKEYRNNSDGCYMDMTVNGENSIESTEQQGFNSPGASRIGVVNDAVCMQLKQLFTAVIDELKQRAGAENSAVCSEGNEELHREHNAESKEQQASYSNETNVVEVDDDAEELEVTFLQQQKITHNAISDSGNNENEVVDTTFDEPRDELKSESSSTMEAHSSMRGSTSTSFRFDNSDASPFTDPSHTLPWHSDRVTRKEDRESVRKEHINTTSKKQMKDRSSFDEEKWENEFEREIIDELLEILDAEPSVTKIDEAAGNSHPGRNIDAGVNPRMPQDPTAMMRGVHHYIYHPRDNSHEEPSTSRKMDFFIPDYDWL